MGGQTPRIRPLNSTGVREILQTFGTRLLARWASVWVIPSGAGPGAVLYRFALPIGQFTLDCWLDQEGTLCMDGATDAEYAELIVWYRSLFPEGCDLGVDNPGGTANEWLVTRPGHAPGLPGLPAGRAPAAPARSAVMV